MVFSPYSDASLDDWLHRVQAGIRHAEGVLSKLCLDCAGVVARTFIDFAVPEGTFRYEAAVVNAQGEGRPVPDGVVAGGLNGADQAADLLTRRAGSRREAPSCPMRLVASGCVRSSTGVFSCGTPRCRTCLLESSAFFVKVILNPA